MAFFLQYAVSTVLKGTFGMHVLWQRSCKSLFDFLCEKSDVMLGAKSDG